MGDGVILEQGKHEELLRNEDGPYARLVIAQRLRETREVVDIDDRDVMGQGSDQIVEVADVEKQILEEARLGRSKSQPSLASEVIKQREAQNPGKREKEYSMFYLFKRMGIINKAAWKSYLFGTLFSIGASALLHLLELSAFLTLVSQRLDASSRLLVLCGVRETEYRPRGCGANCAPEIQLRLL
jgi:ATP-binding cassette, subfamily B (MDR/TAP), member 1